MYKIELHICNSDNWMDENVFINIELPIIPRIGEKIKLTNEQFSELKKQVTRDISICEVYSFYLPYQYNKIDCEDQITPEVMNEIRLWYAYIVVDVLYDFRRDKICVELGDIEHFNGEI